MNPEVSIITPVYNSELFITETIRSVQDQSFENWEHIIVDDCSNDSSLDIINSLAETDERIRVIHHEINKGTAAARNTAIDAASGRYIAFLDADDLWLPDKLSVQTEMMKEHGWAFSFSDYSVIDRDSNMIRDRVGVPASINYRGLLKNTTIGCLTVVIDSEQIPDLRMPPEVRSGQDLALWFRILRSGVIAYGVQEVLAQYRIVPGSVSRNKIQAARRVWKLYRQYENINPVLASWYFLHYAVNAVRKHI